LKHGKKVLHETIEILPANRIKYCKRGVGSPISTSLEGVSCRRAGGGVVSKTTGHSQVNGAWS